MPCSGATHLQGCEAPLAAGETCFPILADSVCFDDAGLGFTCSKTSGVLSSLGGPPKQVCQLCAISPDADDEDMRQKFFRATVRFGPATVRGEINETHISEYRVHALNLFGERIGEAVAVVRPQGPAVADECCDIGKHAAVVELDLSTTWRAAKRLMVSIVADGLELPVGVEVAAIADRHESQRDVLLRQVLEGCLNFQIDGGNFTDSNSTRQAIGAALAEVAALPVRSVVVERLAEGEVCPQPRLLQATSMDSDSAGTTTLATYSIAVPEGMSAAAAAAKLTGIESALALRLQEVLDITGQVEVLPMNPPVIAQRSLPLPQPRWTCDDSPADWRSSSGTTCAEYIAFGWCTETGAQGQFWDVSFGNFSNYSDAAGIAANQACCGCGGGRGVAPIVNTSMFAVLSGVACAEKLPYSEALVEEDGPAGLTTALANTTHTRWVQEVFPTGAAGSADDLTIEWRFNGSATLRERFISATSVGESVRWLILWRGTSHEKHGVWRFSSAAALAMQSKWNRSITASGGFSPEDGAWGAASDVVDGSVHMPWDFVGVGVFVGAESACGAVCFPLGGTANDCQLHPDMRSTLSLVAQADTCGPASCPSGHELKAAAEQPQFCQTDVCMPEECCAPLGVCSLLDCGAAGAYVVAKAPPEFCSGGSCTYDECCEPAPSGGDSGDSGALIAASVVIAIIFAGIGGIAFGFRDRISAYWGQAATAPPKKKPPPAPPPKPPINSQKFDSVMGPGPGSASPTTAGATTAGGTSPGTATPADPWNNFQPRPGYGGSKRSRKVQPGTPDGVADLEAGEKSSAASLRQPPATPPTQGNQTPTLQPGQQTPTTQQKQQYIWQQLVQQEPRQQRYARQAGDSSAAASSTASAHATPPRQRSAAFVGPGASSPPLQRPGSARATPTQQRSTASLGPRSASPPPPRSPAASSSSQAGSLPALPSPMGGATPALPPLGMQSAGLPPLGDTGKGVGLAAGLPPLGAAGKGGALPLLGAGGKGGALPALPSIAVPAPGAATPPRTQRPGSATPQRGPSSVASSSSQGPVAGFSSSPGPAAASFPAPTGSWKAAVATASSSPGPVAASFSSLRPPAVASSSSGAASSSQAPGATSSSSQATAPPLPSLAAGGF